MDNRRGSMVRGCRTGWYVPFLSSSLSLSNSDSTACFLATGLAGIHTISNLKAATPNDLRRTALPVALFRTSLSAETSGAFPDTLTLLSVETFRTLFALAGSFSLLAVLFLELVAGPILAAPIHTKTTMCQQQVTNDNMSLRQCLCLPMPLSLTNEDLPKMNVSHNNDAMCACHTDPLAPVPAAGHQ